MIKQTSLEDFIRRFAYKIANRYPSNCADEEDYIQVGHLKLLEINNNEYKKRDLLAYSITAISRAMREAAFDAMYLMSAPSNIKRIAYKIKIMTLSGKTEIQIKYELNLDDITFITIQALSQTYSLDELFVQPSHDGEPFCALDDIILSSCMDEKDQAFMVSQIDGVYEDKMTRKQRWVYSKKIRHKLTRSGYGI